MKAKTKEEIVRHATEVVLPDGRTGVDMIEGLISEGWDRVGKKGNFTYLIDKSGRMRRLLNSDIAAYARMRLGSGGADVGG